MENIVAIKVIDAEYGLTAFLTWGRIFGAVDTKALEDALEKNLSQFGLKNVLKIEVCESLQEVRDHTFFYEHLFAMAQKRIPFGKSTYWNWQKKMRRVILSGKELYHLGPKIKKGRKNS